MVSLPLPSPDQLIALPNDRGFLLLSDSDGEGNASLNCNKDDQTHSGPSERRYLSVSV